MKKIVLSLILVLLCQMSIPVTSRVVAGSGDTAAGVAAGLIGGAMLTGIARSGRGRARRAEQEAREAKRETEQLRREQQQKEISTIQRSMAVQESSKTTNMLMIMVVLLLLGLIGLAIVVFKMKR